MNILDPRLRGDDAPKATVPWAQVLLGDE